MDVANLSHMPAVKSVMTPFPYAIDIDQTISAARERMIEHRIHHLPVVEGDKLTGIVNQRDIRSDSTSLAGDRTESLRVRDVCSRDPYVVELTVPLDRVLKTMAEGRVEAAIVVKSGKLVGIFTATDAYHAFGSFLRARFPPTGDDAA